VEIQAGGNLNDFANAPERGTRLKKRSVHVTISACISALNAYMNMKSTVQPIPVVTYPALVGQVIAHRRGAEQLGLSPAEILKSADQYALRLHQQGVQIVPGKQDPTAAIVIGLGLLAALFMSSG
jgi:hypothetical protein